MAATLRIDTLKFVRRLTEAGMERQMAEAIAEGLVEADTSDLVTKADLGGLRNDLTGADASLKADLAAAEASIRADLSATDASLKAALADTAASFRAALVGTETSLRLEIAAARTELKTDIADAKAETFRFMMVQAVAIVGLVVTLIKLLP